MKKINALIGALFVISSASAMAHDGTITFTGKVVAQTCAVNTSDKNLTVTLPTVSTSALNANAETTGLTPFAIRLTNCATGMTGAQSVKTYFEPGASTDFNTNNLKNTQANGANNVQIQLLNSDGATTILLGKDVAGQDVHAEAIGTDGSATLRYMAQYYATGQSTAGDVSTTVNYTIAYE